MTFRSAFPDFDPATMPDVPPGFVDASWRNDACPCFRNEAAGLVLWVDYLDPALSEIWAPTAEDLLGDPATHARFRLQRETAGGDGAVTVEDLLATSDWSAILRSIRAAEG